jgi:hypothetical protein
VTNGGGKTGGFEWQPFAAVAAVSIVITLVNATSGLMEAQSRHIAIDPRGPWVLEVSPC